MIRSNRAVVSSGYFNLFLYQLWQMICERRQQHARAQVEVCFKNMTFLAKLKVTFVH